MLDLGVSLLIYRRANMVSHGRSLYREGYRLVLVEFLLGESSCGPRRSRCAELYQQKASSSKHFPHNSFYLASPSVCEYRLYRRATVVDSRLVLSVFVLPLRPLRSLRRPQSLSSVFVERKVYVPPASPYPEAIVAV